MCVQGSCVVPNLTSFAALRVDRSFTAFDVNTRPILRKCVGCMDELELGVGGVRIRRLYTLTWNMFVGHVDLLVAGLFTTQVLYCYDTYE